MLKKTANSKNYLLFLATVFVLMLVSQGVVHYFLSDQEDAGREIQLAGRQRTLVQQIAKLSLEISYKSERNENIREELKELRVLNDRWQASQRALLQGDRAYKIDGHKSAVIEEMYEVVNPLFFDIKHSVDHVVENDGQTSDDAIATILMKDDLYLDEMNKVVGQYTREQSQKVVRLRYIGWGLMTLTLVLLAVAFQYIVRPFQTKLKAQNEELLELNKNLDKVGKIKSEFLANMSHEVRTPLNGILGMANVLSRTSLSAEQKEYVSTIETSAENLTVILNDMLDYSRIEGGNLELENEAFNVHSAVEEVVDMFKPSALEKKLELILYISSSVPNFVRGDSARLKQVLINLLNNAVKFTDRGEVVVRVEHVTQEQEFHQLRFSVADTGIGVAREAAEQLFQSFTQADGSNTRRYGGTGLGLALCKQIVNLMGGRIWVESNEEKGSHFAFTIVVEETEDSATAVNLEALRGMKALIVDDNTTNLKILVKQLSHWGVQATPFNSPELVLEIIDNLKKFDICILDMQMPQIDGRALAERIRARYSKKELPIVILSSIGDGLMDEHQSAPWNRYLTKPVKPSRLQNALLRIRGQHLKAGANTAQRAEMFKKHDLNIAVVNGDQMQAALIERSFKHIGFKPRMFQKGEELIEQMAGNDFDVVVLGEEVGGMNAIEAAERIQKLIDADECPLLVLTAHSANEEFKKAALKGGVEEVMQMPIDEAELGLMLSRWFPVFDQL